MSGIINKDDILKDPDFFLLDEGLDPLTVFENTKNGRYFSFLPNHPADGLGELSELESEDRDYRLSAMAVLEDIYREDLEKSFSNQQRQRHSAYISNRRNFPYSPGEKNITRSRANRRIV